MNKEEIIKELDELVNRLDEDFKIVKEPYSCGQLTLSCCGDWICWFCNFDKYNFHINISDRHNPQKHQEAIAKTGVINKFYTRAVELLSKCEPKYTVKITHSEEFYLNIDTTTDDQKIIFDELVDSCTWKNKFTQKEISELKKRDDLAIDWNKAIIREVDDDNE